MLSVLHRHPFILDTAGIYLEMGSPKMLPIFARPHLASSGTASSAIRRRCTAPFLIFGILPAMTMLGALPAFPSGCMRVIRRLLHASHSCKDPIQAQRWRAAAGMRASDSVGGACTAAHVEHE